MQPLALNANWLGLGSYLWCALQPHLKEVVEKQNKKTGSSQTKDTKLQGQYKRLDQTNEYAAFCCPFEELVASAFCCFLGRSIKS